MLILIYNINYRKNKNFSKNMQIQIGRTYNDYYKENISSKTAEFVSEFLTKEIGYGIIVIAVIVGTYLISSGLYYLAHKETSMGQGKKPLARLLSGGLLVSFAIVIGIILQTMTLATR